MLLFLKRFSVSVNLAAPATNPSQDFSTSRNQLHTTYTSSRKMSKTYAATIATATAVTPIKCSNRTCFVNGTRLGKVKLLIGATEPYVFWKLYNKQTFLFFLICNNFYCKPTVVLKTCTVGINSKLAFPKWKFKMIVFYVETNNLVINSTLKFNYSNELDDPTSELAENYTRLFRKVVSKCFRSVVLKLGWGV